MTIKSMLVIIILMAAKGGGIGSVLSVKDHTVIQRGAEKIDVRKGMELRGSDRIKTDRNGSAVIRLNDGTVISVGKSSGFDLSTITKISAEQQKEKSGILSSVKDRFHRKERMRPSTMALGIRGVSRPKKSRRSTVSPKKDAERVLCFHDMKWISIAASGSKASYMYGSDDAAFSIIRLDRGPKKDIDTHGFAYLRSNGMTLPNEWREVIFEGRWWQEALLKKNYEEMLISVHGRYPELIHGKRKDGLELHNYIEVSYDTWNRTLRFSGRGSEGQPHTFFIKRDIPLEPTPFRLVITRFDEGSRYIKWEFYEQRNGVWEKLYSEIQNLLFEQCDMRNIYWKIGGWTTWENPVESIIKFDTMSFRIDKMEISDPSH